MRTNRKAARLVYLAEQTAPVRRRVALKLIRLGPPASPVRTLLIVHGIAMTAWMLLAVVQPLLIAKHHRRLHLSLGLAGAGLGACIVVLGICTAIVTTRVEADVVRFGLHRLQFMAIPATSMPNFGILVTIVVANRRRAEIHRPMMLLSTLAIMGAVTSRIAPSGNSTRRRSGLRCLARTSLRS